MIIKGLSLWQPWASLMSLGAKKIETRSWPTEYGGLIAIHAAKKWNGELQDLCHHKPFREALFPGGAPVMPGSLTRRAFVAIGCLHRVLSTTTHATATPSMNTDEFWFGDYSENRYMWIFDGIWKLREPVYASGHQGLWNLNEDEVDVVSAMLPDDIEEQLEREAA